MSLLAPRPAGAVEIMPWDQSGDFASALARAAKAKKLVFIDFYATWCGPCKMMDRTAYSDSSVAQVAASFVNRKVDAEKGEGIALAQRYRIDAYPTLVVVDPAGTEVARETGYRPADRLRRFLDDVRSGRGTISGLEKMVLKKDGNTFENRVALGEKYAEVGRAEEAREQFDRALEIDPADPGHRASELLLTIARGRSQAGNPGAAIADAATFLTRFPDSPRRVEALAIKAQGQAEEAQKDSAVATYRQILLLSPEDPGAMTAFARFCAVNGAGLDEALAVSTKAVDATGGKDADALDGLAEVHAARGEYDDAVSTEERALDASPNRGDLRAKLERYQEQAVAAVRAKAH
jgi:tetratricopeptide (TPR) repeat protein